MGEECGRGSAMKRLNIVVEGQTEEAFVRGCLYEHLLSFDTAVTARLLGGATKTVRMLHFIRNTIKEDQTAYVSTMIDLYGLPSDFPGKRDSHNLPCIERVELLEGKMKLALARRGNSVADAVERERFSPYLQLHEFESLLFSSIEGMSEWLTTSEHQRNELQAIVRTTQPEEINDSENTAPSKRLQRVYPEYDKVLHGPLIAETIGLDVIRQKCGHFDSWLRKLETLGEIGGMEPSA
jgi:hypothetical protein